MLVFSGLKSVSAANLFKGLFSATDYEELVSRLIDHSKLVFQVYVPKRFVNNTVTTVEWVLVVRFKACVTMDTASTYVAKHTV